MRRHLLLIQNPMTTTAITSTLARRSNNRFHTHSNNSGKISSQHTCPVQHCFTSQICFSLKWPNNKICALLAERSGTFIQYSTVSTYSQNTNSVLFLVIPLTLSVSVNFLDIIKAEVNDNICVHAKKNPNEVTSFANNFLWSCCRSDFEGQLNRSST